MSISVVNVSKHFKDFPALTNVSIDIEDGSLTSILGPSGSGKSTLLRVISGLEHPDSGHVRIFGVDMSHMPPQKRGVGFVFQHYAAFKHLTVRDNVAFGLKIRKRPKDEINRKVNELLELVQLTGFADRYPGQLSGGQRQRMALARALAVEPRVMLLDEPFGALDARVRQELRSWLRRLHDEVKVTTVLVTHDQEEAMEISDHVIVMNNGQVEQIGQPIDLYDQPANEFVMSFIGRANRIGGALVRPHDMDILVSPVESAIAATVQRVIYLGFEVRAELVTHAGDAVLAQITRSQADELKMEPGQIAYLKLHESSGFAQA
jgi:sulfate transport system ATP-binding protein